MKHHLNWTLLLTSPIDSDAIVTGTERVMENLLEQEQRHRHLSDSAVSLSLDTMTLEVQLSAEAPTLEGAMELAMTAMRASTEQAGKIAVSHRRLVVT